METFGEAHENGTEGSKRANGRYGDTGMDLPHLAFFIFLGQNLAVRDHRREGSSRQCEVWWWEVHMEPTYLITYTHATQEKIPFPPSSVPCLS